MFKDLRKRGKNGSADKTEEGKTPCMIKGEALEL